MELLCKHFPRHYHQTHVTSIAAVISSECPCIMLRRNITEQLKDVKNRWNLSECLTEIFRLDFLWGYFWVKRILQNSYHLLSNHSTQNHQLWTVSEWLFFLWEVLPLTVQSSLSTFCPPAHSEGPTVPGSPPSHIVFPCSCCSLVVMFCLWAELNSSIPSKALWPSWVYNWPRTMSMSKHEWFCFSVQQWVPPASSLHTFNKLSSSQMEWQGDLIFL